MSNENLSSITETTEINDDARVIISQTGESEGGLYSASLEDVANKLELYHDINTLTENNFDRITVSENLFDNDFKLHGYFNLKISDDNPHGLINDETYRATSKFYAIPENTVALYIENIREAATFTVCLYTDNNDSSYSYYINKSRIIEDETATGGMRAIDSNVKYFRVYVDADFEAGENNVIISNKPITADTPVEFKEEVTQKSGVFKDVLDKYVQTSELNQIVNKVDNLFADAIFEGGTLLCGSGRVSSSDEYKRTGYISIPKGTSDLYVRLSDKPKTEFTILFYSKNDGSDATELYEYTRKYEKLLTSKKQHVSLTGLGFDEGGEYAMRIYTDVDFTGDVLISPVITPEEGVYKITDSFASEMLSVMKKDVDENKVKKLREFSENIKDDIERFSAFCSSDSMADNVKVYHVGKGCKFETIQEALVYWEKIDEFAPAIVYISNGVYTYNADKPKPYVKYYNPVIFVDSSADRQKNISFIGESREGVIVKSAYGRYVDAPILIRHGNVQIKNMTVIADHSENNNFSYFGKDIFNESEDTFSDAEDGYKITDYKQMDSDIYVTLSRKLTDDEEITILLFGTEDESSLIESYELESGEAETEGFETDGRYFKVSSKYVVSGVEKQANHFRIKKKVNSDIKIQVSNEGASESKAYAIHIDGGNNNGQPGKVLVENVTAISYQAPAFGMGTIADSTIRLQNCKAISFTEPVPAEVHSRKGLSYYYGSLLYHNEVASNKPDTEKLELIDVEVYSKNSEAAMCLMSEENNAGKVNLLAVDTVLLSDKECNNQEDLRFVNMTESKLNLDPDSFGNTCENLNA